MNQLGCDISKWQPDFDFDQAGAVGLTFVFVKATDGVYVDAQFANHWPLAKDSDLLCGAYHWFQPSLAPVLQANAFLDAVLPGPGVMLAIDLEEKKGAGPLLPGYVMQFLDRIDSVCDNKIVIYTSPGYWLKWFAKSMWADRYPLWIANYGVASPNVPLPWAPTRWTFWQFTAKAYGPKYGTDPLTSKSIDLNLFNGDIAELRTFWQV